MANKFVVPLTPVVGVVAGQTATLDLPIGPRYHVIWLQGTVKREGTAPALSDIFGLITVKINGKPVRTHTGTEIDALNSLMGANFASSYTGGGGSGGVSQSGDTIVCLLPLFLAEPWRKQYAETQLMAWPTSWPGGNKLATLQIEIAVPSTASTSLHAITAFAETDNVQGQMNGSVPVLTLSKWNRLSVPYTGAGDLYITSLPKREIYQQISMFTQTEDPISAIKVKVDGSIIKDITKTRNDATLVARDMNRLGIVAARFDLVFDYDDDPKSALLMQYGNASVQDFQVIPTLASASAGTKIVTLLYQTYGTPD